MLLERGIHDILRVLVLTRNSVYSAHSIEDVIPHVYKMEGHRPFRENPLKWMMQTSDNNNNTVLLNQFIHHVFYLISSHEY